MKLSCALVILSSALVVSVVSAQNRCGPNSPCADLRCCSIWGYCGDTTDYCGSTCQNKCWSGERSDHRCGASFGNPPCGQRRCCSAYGYCGSGASYCGAGCQYRCSGNSLARGAFIIGNGTVNAVSDIVTESLFNEMFSHQVEDCPSRGFYSYNAFITAAESFPGFGTAGDVGMRKREIAAFLARISEATSGKRSDVEDVYSWGLCHINTTAATENEFCTSSAWPCASGKNYGPRGAIQLAHNINYGLAGQALGLDLIRNPDLVALNPIVSFKTALWFWMTQHDNNPSCHDTVVNAVVPRNVGHGGSSAVGFYKRYCDMLGVSYGQDHFKYWFDNTAPGSSAFSRIEMIVA